jgi:hypothetical protein
MSGTLGNKTAKLGTVHVSSTGVIDQKNGIAAGQPVNFALKGALGGTGPFVTNTDGSNESAVCISDSAANYGNQAPLTVL